MLGKVFALAARDLISKYLPKHFTACIKWPNDILVNGHKIGGILIQNSIQGSILQNTVAGIGLNINQDHFHTYRPPATSLLLETGITHPLENLLHELCALVEVYYEALRSGDFAAIDELYLRHLMLLGKPAVFQRQADLEIFEARILGVTESGRLLVENGHIQETFGLKEIQLLTFSK